MDLGRLGTWRRRFAGTNGLAEIEAAGYSVVWVGTSPSVEQARPFLEATTAMTVATGILNVWQHDPGAVAAAHAEVTDAFPGRFLLGVGIGHPEATAEYRSPLQTMRGFFDGLDAAPRPVPRNERIGAALGPKMLALAAERSLGAHTYFVTPEHTARAREILGTGPLLAPEQAVLLETDPSAARALAREHHLGFYLALPNYVNSLRRLGFEDEDFQDGGSDRLVDAIVAWGDAEAIRRRIREHHQAGADHVAIQPLAADRGLGLDQLRELAPALLAD
jgi:probable F420-dependent oxidoreductase